MATRTTGEIQAELVTCHPRFDCGRIPRLYQELVESYRAELAAEREKHCSCVIDDPRDDKPSSECQYHQELRERAERAEAACAKKDRAIETANQVSGELSSLVSEYNEIRDGDLLASEIRALVARYEEGDK